MFLLLRFFGFSQFFTVLGALSFQFSGFQALFFYPENVTSSIIYYPLLWLVLAKYLRSKPALAVAFGGLLGAAVLLAGNQQSHSYLVLFLFCFVLGYASSFPDAWLKILLVCGTAFLLGCALAAPVFIPEVELFRTSNALVSRGIQPTRLGPYLFTGVFSLTGIFPWLVGSFRSIDLGKLLDQQGAAFVVHLGTPVMVLAILGLAGCRRAPWSRCPENRTALFLVVIYFVGICSTPLLNLLFIRSAGLAVLGLLVLAGSGLEGLAQNSFPEGRRVIKWVAVLLTAAVVAVHIFAFAIYPHIKGKVLEVALQKDANNVTLPSSPALRRFQVNNLPNEITFKNPEPLLAFIGVMSLVVLTFSSIKAPKLGSIGVFVCNVLPLLLFFSRYVPYSPVRYWDRLLAGGPEQKALMELAGRDMRLDESAPTRYDYAFPGVTACYYGIHCLLGNSSFPLVGPGQTKASRGSNILYNSQRQSEHGEVRIITTNQVRFVWADRQSREVTITEESPNSIRLRISSGPSGELIRTDTYYPGWRVKAPGSVKHQRNKDGFFSVVVPTEAIELLLYYKPVYSMLERLLCMGSSLVILGLFLWPKTKKPQMIGAIP